MNCRTHEHRRFERTLRPWGFYSEGHARPRVGASERRSGRCKRGGAVKSVPARQTVAIESALGPLAGRAARPWGYHAGSISARRPHKHGCGADGGAVPRDVISHESVDASSRRRRSIRSPPHFRAWNAVRPARCTLRPRIGRDYPLGLSILLSGGKETNKDSPSSCERTGKSPAPNPAGAARREMWC